MLPLSVVVATTQPWPEARDCLDSLHGQVREQGSEIVLAHRGDGFDPDTGRTYPLVTPVVAPGRSANELRGIAFEHVRGEIVAITEDHCVVAPDWCRRHLEAHRTHPHAAAVGGAVENGACDHAIDWAAFFMANASAMLPLDDGPAKSIAAQANVSYKRRFLPERAPEGGFFELDHNAQLRTRGEQLIVDSRIVAHHVQSLGFLSTCAIWFHASRTWAAHDGAERRAHGRALRALLTPLRHPVAIVRHLGKVWAKGRMRGRIAQVAPLMLLLGACATAGIAIGYAAGEGGSARHIR